MTRRRSKKKQKSPLSGVVWLAAVILLVLWVINSPGFSFLLPGNQYFAPEDFARRGGQITYLAGEAEQGIDVSYYQGEIDWQAVRESGISFAFVRVGYRSSEDGTIHEDEMARKNLTGAAAAGVKVGAYFFSQAVNDREAAEEAEFTLALLKEFQTELPVVYDWEPYNGDRTDGMTRDDLTRCVYAFCDTVELAGYDSMVYFNRDLSRTLLDVTRLSRYEVWFAMYEDYPRPPCKIDYWQYTDEGTVPGITGKVDKNLYFP